MMINKIVGSICLGLLGMGSVGTQIPEVNNNPVVANAVSTLASESRVLNVGYNVVGFNKITSPKVELNKTYLIMVDGRGSLEQIKNSLIENIVSMLSSGDVDDYNALGTTFGLGDMEYNELKAKKSFIISSNTDTEYAFKDSFFTSLDESIKGLISEENGRGCLMVRITDEALIKPFNDLCLTSGGQFDFNSVTHTYLYELQTKEIKQAPTIEGTTNFIVNVNNMLTKEEILSHITAVDDTDGVLEVHLESSTYDPANKKVGDYEMLVSATDKAQNKTTATIKIKVVDIDKPVLSGTATYTASYDEKISLDTIKGGITISDNLDTDLQLELVSNGYEGHENELGSHQIVFRTTDKSSNVSENFTITINVEDKKAPIISAPGTIKTPNNKKLSLEEIKTKISVNDGLDGPIVEFQISGYDEYSANYNVVGSYTLTITAKDTHNNTSTAKIIITTEDKTNPNIYFDDYFIILDKGQQLTNEQIKEMASKVLGISLESISSVDGEYDVQKMGNYKLVVNTITNEHYTFNLKVNDNDYEEVELNIWQKICKFFTILIFNNDDYYHTDGWFSGFPKRWNDTWNLMFGKTLYKQKIA